METNNTPVIVTGDTVNGQSVVIAEGENYLDSIKMDIIKRATANDACSEGKRQAKNATTLEGLLLVIKSHAPWLFNTKTIDGKWLEDTFGTDLLFKNHIYTSGKHSVNVSEANVQIFLCGSSSATVETWGSSSATVKTCDSSSAHIGQYHSSKLEHSLGDGVCPMIKHFTEKKVFIKTSDFEIVQVN